MRRTDRLFDIIQILRDGKLYRAQDIAERLEVSTRTIYRDMDTLSASGVPIEGERGVGYMITQAISLPPLTLTASELEALNLGLAIVGQAADDALKTAAETLADKIDAVLPAQTIAEAEAWKFAVYPFADPTRNLTHMPLLRSAIKARQKVRLTYTSRENAVTSRVIRPLHMEYWGRVWTLTSWCELRNGFRVFRLDLIESAEALPDLFVDEPGKTLADYVP
ncbi:helix-turn-helix transcriptional regulator [Sulfitobacter geojensis]|uniref:YafY family transcriptional regulator n=1 Tax=Sulfitobacter geojensis TaxID=1342299 RepID=A0AAE2VV65_9RHOB|nr:YafY family protein [Sulfitobacter geojensis]KHA52703.1 putative helix-turn-helix protein [Sulfitobacter geojensis]MBM1687953.1 YafY family transcriptional regulator [Sulfitobacter geojensis]MBM1692020.1 YafY family transcriptional regulator [Sulfitobacter geojensis]MBM1704186.1 YafY family transcriptional regulator [Sulfitobacter geojensis]MBM1708244.1 YafY family transcriptional regulator [Sulfitobacter geojensis]